MKNEIQSVHHTFSANEPTDIKTTEGNCKEGEQTLHYRTPSTQNGSRSWSAHMAPGPSHEEVEHWDHSWGIGGTTLIHHSRFSQTVLQTNQNMIKPRPVDETGPFDSYRTYGTSSRKWLSSLTFFSWSQCQWPCHTHSSGCHAHCWIHHPAES